MLGHCWYWMIGKHPACKNISHHPVPKQYMVKTLESLYGKLYFSIYVDLRYSLFSLYSCVLLTVLCVCVCVCCHCQGLNVVAYASYCQLDNWNRPVAGYINICPQTLSDHNYNEEKIYWVWTAVCTVLLIVPRALSDDAVWHLFVCLSDVCHVHPVGRRCVRPAG